MAFRILPGDIYECDTIEELRKLQASQQSRKSPHRQTNSSRKKRLGLSDNAKAFLDLLIRAEHGVNTEQASLAMGIEARTLPPVVRHIIRWCRDSKHDHQKLIIRRSAYINRKPVTVYSATEEGRRVFASVVADAPRSSNGKGAGSTVNTS